MRLVFQHLINAAQMRAKARRKQLVHRYAKRCGKFGKQRNIGLARAVFPFTHRLRRHMQRLGKLFLRHIAPQPMGADLIAHIVFHLEHSFPVCLYCSIPLLFTQSTA